MAQLEAELARVSATIAVSEQRELEVQQEGERLHQQAETTGKQNITESTAAEEHRPLGRKQRQPSE